MATIDRIQHKRSSTPGAVPDTGTMLDGELFINLADAKLYIKNAGGTMVCIGKVLTNVNDVPHLKAGDYTAKGMLLVGTGVSGFSGLALGTTGQVLTVDTSTVTGVKWATP